MFYVCSVTSTPPSPANITPCPERAARNLAVLDEMIQINRDAARAFGRMIETQADAVEALVAGDLTDRGYAFVISAPEFDRMMNRITRSIRLCIMLQARIENPPPPRTEPAEAQTAPIAANRRDQVATAVKRLIESRDRDHEGLFHELVERLDAIGDAEVLATPIEVLIARLLDELELTPGLDAPDTASSRETSPTPTASGP